MPQSISLDNIKTIHSTDAIATQNSGTCGQSIWKQPGRQTDPQLVTGSSLLSWVYSPTCLESCANVDNASHARKGNFAQNSGLALAPVTSVNGLSATSRPGFPPWNGSCTSPLEHPPRINAPGRRCNSWEGQIRWFTSRPIQRADAGQKHLSLQSLPFAQASSHRLSTLTGPATPVCLPNFVGGR